MTEKEQVILKQTDENKNDFDLEIEEVDLSQVDSVIPITSKSHGHYRSSVFSR